MTTLTFVYILVCLAVFYKFWNGKSDNLPGLIFKVGILGALLVLLGIIASVGALVLIIKACIWLIELL